MPFIIMHKTNPRWEAGERPSPELIARVGTLIGELAKEGRLLAGEGLHASSLGVRLRFSGGNRTITTGPFEGENELPWRFSILRVASIDDAIEWASRQAEVLGDVEIDIRPVTEAWDIGMMARPEGLATIRAMALIKATPDSESGRAPTAEQARDLARVNDAMTRAGVHLATEALQPSSRGRRYKNTGAGVRVLDGPFTESKELIAGYVIVDAPSLDDASRIARNYLDAVETEEVDVREIESGIRTRENARQYSATMKRLATGV